MAIPCAGLTSELLQNNPAATSQVIEDRLLNHWIDKERFKEETLFLVGVTGIDEGTVMVNYNVVCFAVDGLHRFVYYTTESSLEESVKNYMDEAEDVYVPDSDRIVDMSSSDSDEHSAVLDGPPFYDEFTIQPIDAIGDWDLNYMMGSCVENVVKYHMTGDLGFLEDAVWFLIKERETVERSLC